MTRIVANMTRIMSDKKEDGNAQVTIVILSILQLELAVVPPPESGSSAGSSSSAETREIRRPFCERDERMNRLEWTG